jgi:hypothetical protein
MENGRSPAGGPGGRMNPDNLFFRNGDKSVGEVFPQVFFGGERQTLQIVQGLNLPGGDPVDLENLLIGG